MKFFILSCLLVAGFASEKASRRTPRLRDLDPKLLSGFLGIDDETQNDPADRWEKERKYFVPGLKIIDDQKNSVELSLSPKPLTNEPRTFFGGETIFYLYNNNHTNSPEKFQPDSLENIKFDASIPTVFITHGWMNSAQSRACTLVRDAYLIKGGFNVVVVDWSSTSKNLYEISVSQVHDVGTEVANVISGLERAGYLKIEDTLLVGHSLGAHVMGIAGHALDARIKGIFGLDPALPLFRFAPPGWRISEESAQYVEVIHTNGGILGSYVEQGHADFYVHGGIQQPDCSFNIACSHDRAFELYAESINSRVPFLGQECIGHLDFTVDLCEGEYAVAMGGAETNRSVEGVFLVPTNTGPPYALGASNVESILKLFSLEPLYKFMKSAMELLFG